jgi:putative Mg2+ transporter-C (MgtC) family protein
LRTHLLVTVGAALFTIVSAHAFRDFPYSRANGIVFDPTRIAAQIVSGIGFLGAGAIIRQGLSVRGLTTAATLWVSAAIGIAAGAGFHRGAVIATAIVLLSLWPLRVISYPLVERVRQRERRLVVDVRGEQHASSVLGALEAVGARVHSFTLEAEEGGLQRIAIEVDLERGIRAEALRRLAALDVVQGVRWD